MRKRILISVMAMALTTVVASPALAGEPPANAGSPTCAGVVTHGPLANHGEHVVVDYVRSGEPGARGGPAHFGLPFKPGASFCLEQANSKSIG